MTLSRLAAENAVDGWVRTTWAAAKARHQGSHATDLEVRVVMQAVAVDEAQHASLSFRLHAWLVPRLSAADRDLVAEVARWSIAKLRASRRGPALGYHRTLGLPGADASARILDVLEHDVWATAA
jgi:hypothetical protein